MSYRVLARAYRSQSFDEVVGQEAIGTTLKNAITSGRIHHGYLFTGTRGVGKTSMARILAKALNCLNTKEATTTPCGTCDVCTAVAEGQDVDVVEIDAASHTGVDDMRELRSNAAFRPTRSRYKVYIIDEVHMLSTSAFNALLKTLEEPPSHVKFILATTEIHKVPATIQSRCQRFDFRAIEPDVIATQLRKILEAEKIRSEEGVIRRIARLANGSMRDALSLLDKVLSYSPDALTVAVMEELVPPPHDELAAGVVNALAAGDPAAALRAFEIALQHGRTIDRFCEDMIAHLRTLMLLRVCGAETELVDAAAQMRGQLAEQAAGFDPPTYVYMIALLEELRRHVKFNGAARALADAAIVRLAMARQFSELESLLSRLETGETTRALPIAEAAKKKELIIKKATGNRQQATVVGSAIADQQYRAREEAASEQYRARQEAALNVEKSKSRKVETGDDSMATQAWPMPPGNPEGPSRADWDRAAKHPLVQKIKEAFEGTLFDVQSAALAHIDTPTYVEAETTAVSAAPEAVTAEDEE